MDFNKKLEPFLKTKDPILFDFIMFMLADYPLVPAKWSEMLFERALLSDEKLGTLFFSEKIFPLTEKAAGFLIEGLKRGDKSSRYFEQPLLNIEMGLAYKMKDELLPYVPKKLWDTFNFIIKTDDEDAMWKEFAGVLAKIEKSYDWVDIARAKRLADGMMIRGWIDEKEIMGILEGEEGSDIEHSPWGMLAAYMAGKQKLPEYIPHLAKLLASENDMVQESACDGLIAYQSIEAIEAAIPYFKNEDAQIYAISVVSNIKTDEALNVLKKHYWLASPGGRELFFEALCYSLSPQALPEIQDFMENPPDGMIVEYELNLFGYHLITGTPTPYINEWRRTLVDQEQRVRDHRRGEVQQAAPVTRGEKIGRNDPCPCGSGKKYKKCCGS